MSQRRIFNEISLEKQIPAAVATAVKGNPFLGFVGAVNTMMPTPKSQVDTSFPAVSIQNNSKSAVYRAAQEEEFEHWRDVEQRKNLDQREETQKTETCSCFPFFSRKKKEENDISVNQANKKVSIR